MKVLPRMSTMSIVGSSFPFLTASSIAHRRKVFRATVGSLLGSPFSVVSGSPLSDASSSFSLTVFYRNWLSIITNLQLVGQRLGCKCRCECVGSKVLVSSWLGSCLYHRSCDYFHVFRKNLECNRRSNTIGDTNKSSQGFVGCFREATFLHCIVHWFPKDKA